MSFVKSVVKVTVVTTLVVDASMRIACYIDYLNSMKKLRSEDGKVRLEQAEYVLNDPYALPSESKLAKAVYEMAGY